MMCILFDITPIYFVALWERKDTAMLQSFSDVLRHKESSLSTLTNSLTSTENKPATTKQRLDETKNSPISLINSVTYWISYWNYTYILCISSWTKNWVAASSCCKNKYRFGGELFKLNIYNRVLCKTGFLLMLHLHTAYWGLEVGCVWGTMKAYSVDKFMTLTCIIEYWKALELEKCHLTSELPRSRS